MLAPYEVTRLKWHGRGRTAGAKSSKGICSTGCEQGGTVLSLRTDVEGGS